MYEANPPELLFACCSPCAADYLALFEQVLDQPHCKYHTGVDAVNAWSVRLLRDASVLSMPLKQAR
jgi:hypothetical protein